MGSYIDYYYIDKMFGFSMGCDDQKYFYDVGDGMDPHLIPDRYLAHYFYFTFYMHHENPLNNPLLKKADLSNPDTFWNKTFTFWQKEKGEKSIFLMYEPENSVVTPLEFMEVMKEYIIRKKENKDEDEFDISSLTPKQQFIFKKIQTWINEFDAFYPQYYDIKPNVEYGLLDVGFEYGPHFTLRDDLDQSMWHRKETNAAFNKYYQKYLNQAENKKRKTRL